MSAPDTRPEGRPQPARRDLTAVPGFLEGHDPTGRPSIDRARRALELPRPTNPPPPVEAGAEAAIDPASLPMPSLSRRRVFTVAGVLLAGWLAISFARQVGEASAATTRAEQLRDANAALRDEIALLEADLTRVQDADYILQQGRAVGLGGRNEIPFALAGDAPPLAFDAPGSAAARLGSSPEVGRPLDIWLTVLFGND